MSLVTMAGYMRQRRGYDLYENKAVIAYTKINEDEYTGKVKGSKNQIYDVYVNVAKPRSSTCNCPFAEGRWAVCKHKVALYFTVRPDEAKEYYRYYIEPEREYELAEATRQTRFLEFLGKKTKKELLDIIDTFLWYIEDNERHRLMADYLGDEYYDDAYDYDYDEYHPDY